ncbi:MAG: hypothetical protein GXO21_05600 [Aquificae bacterium]|nr:hypothetical protein [Aquificota bacterium]
MDNKIFLSELLQDLPLWTALIMSIYPNLQNDTVFYISLAIGVITSLYILYLMKKGEYSIDKLTEKPSEMLPYIIYSFFLLLFLLFLTIENKLYMSNFVWGYVILTAAGEMFFLGKATPQE